MVDMNNDGWLDIFICRSAATDTSLLSNLLFINNRDLTFRERGHELKLDQDKSYTIHAAFLDFDKDGDLDIYLVNVPDFEVLKQNPPHLPQSFMAELMQSKISPQEMIQLEPNKLKFNFKGSDKLLRNDLEKGFVDITATAALPNETGMGLHATIVDANQDGWPDIYVCNDFIAPDFLYINQKNGTFVDSAFYYFKQQSFSSMCADFGDLDNDGAPEAIITEMLPYEPFREKAFITYYPIYYYEKIFSKEKKRLPQYLKNSLFRNVKGKWLAEIAHYAKLARTDWSWSALIADFNNDGWQDVFISTGMAVEFNHLDLYMRQNSAQQRYIHPKKLEELLMQLPRNPQPNFLFINNKNFHFLNCGKINGLEWRGITPAATYADLDNDGDLDLVYNNQDTLAFILRNNSREVNNTSFLTIAFEKKDYAKSLGAKVYLKAGDGFQFREVGITKGYQAATENKAHFGLPSEVKIIDTLLIVLPDNKALLFTKIRYNQTLKVDCEKAKPLEGKIMFAWGANASPLFLQKPSLCAYKHQENKFVDFEYERLLLKKYSCQGPGIAVSDANQDGKEDIFLGNGMNSTPALFLQNENGTFVCAEQQPWASSILQDCVGGVFLDYDNDRDNDFLLFFAGNEKPLEKPDNYLIKLYTNKGRGFFERDTAFPSIQLPTLCVAPADYNRDGFIDLFIGSSFWPGNWPLAKGSFLLKNNKGVFEVESRFSWLDTLGAINDALFSDIDNDGWLDLIVVGEGTPVRFIKNYQGVLKPISTNLDALRGFWQSIIAGDFDNDGDTDYVVGNIGENYRYQARPEEPTTIIVQDFDRNGQLDPLTLFYDNGQETPLFGRDLICDQIPAFRNQFLTYADFGKATRADFFKAFPYQPQKVITIESFSSLFIENLGNFEFRSVPLPPQAQLFPIKGMLAQDLNQDALLDILLVGNEYSTHPNFGRQDAGNGLALMGAGNGNFIAQPNSGFFVPTDTRALAKIMVNNKPYFLVSANDDSLYTFVLKNEQPVSYLFQFLPGEAYAHVYYKTSKTPRKIENIPFTSYLSFSPPNSLLNKSLIEKIVTFNANHRLLRTLKP
jgi:hypothetical protein